MNQGGCPADLTIPCDRSGTHCVTRVTAWKVLEG